MMSRTIAVCLLSTLLLAADDPKASDPAKTSKEIRLTECLTLSRSGRAARTPVAADPVAAAMAAGKWTAPKEGDAVDMPDGSKASWRAAKASENGAFSGAGFRGGYAFFNVPSDSDHVMILEAKGHAMVEINGVPRAGDTYAYGYVKLPVRLRKGENAFLFRTGRGQLSAKLVEPKGDALIETGDTTLPDLIAGQEVKTWGAVVVVNATEATLKGAVLNATIGDGPTIATPVPTLPPLSIRKVGFRLEGPAPVGEGERKVALSLSKEGETSHGPSAEVALRVRKPSQTHKRTFISAIDGSVQYFGVVPAGPAEGPDAPLPGLILTLHGAGVEGIGQAAVYAPKSWAHVVAPTNRRPYGFDWEDWGRLDAIEVLELARAQLKTDPRRTWLTGHSMGGHGTWHVGVTFPDRFAAIAPSAGWVSMSSYAGARPIEGTMGVAGLIQRGSSPSDTLALAPNLLGLGVYVLHGSADDNVPVGQARQMRKALAEFHPDFAYHEQLGAGHWWGNACCDWPPLIEFLKGHEIPALKDVLSVDFVTASPSVSATCHWATIEAQAAAFKLSALHLKYNPERRRFSGTTENVSRLSLDVQHVTSGNTVQVTLDAQEFADLEKPAGGEPKLWFRRTGKTWSVAAKPSPSLKGPHRSGPFKDAFRNRVVFVYGTRGTPEENDWALAKARFDAERFWYQGNASVDVVADSAFDAAAEPDRNVILYGHAESNAAWPPLLKESPVQVSRGKLRVGDRERTGDDLACLFIRPRPGSDKASVGVVTGTGLAGLRLAETPAYFTSGVAYPDCLVLGPETLAKGVEGVIAAGYFGEDWGVASGEFAWHD